MGNLKYPKGETVWTEYYNKSHELRFIITSKTTRENYFLYELVGEEFKKLGRAKTPTELEIKYKIKENLSRI